MTRVRASNYLTLGVCVCEWCIFLFSYFLGNLLSKQHMVLLTSYKRAVNSTRLFGPET